VHPRFTAFKYRLRYGDNNNNDDKDQLFVSATLRSHSAFQPHSRASISQDYWGDIKEDWVSGGRKSPNRVQGRSLGRGPGDKVPQKLKLFVKLHIIFALKYNKQQLLLLSTFLEDLDIVSCAHSSRHSKRHHF